MAERDAQYYDAFFETNQAYHIPYRDSHYFPLWVQVEFQLRPYKDKRILELGCGTGQFAHYLHDLGYPHYRGTDFSKAAVERARAKSPFRFEVADATASTPYSEPFDVALSLEMLEHIEGDLAVMDRIPPGTVCVFSVPNFDHPGHVRWFRSEYQVRKRYYRKVDIRSIHLINNIYLVTGTRSEFSPSLLQRMFTTRQPVTLNALWQRIWFRLVHTLKIPHT